MFPLDSFRLARTLAATAGVLTASSVALAATTSLYSAAAVLAMLAPALGYGSRYEARNVRVNRRTARVRRNLQAVADAQAAQNTVRLADFRAREHAAIYGEVLS